MKWLDTLLQLSNSTRCICLFCCWWNDELQIVTEGNKKPVCYHQNIGIDQNTIYVKVCKRYSDFYSNITASWQYAIKQWGVFSIDVLHAFVLKCTEREKCVQESPSSVVITKKQFVSNLNYVSYPLKVSGFDLLMLKWSSTFILLRLPFPHASAVSVMITFPSL